MSFLLDTNVISEARKGQRADQTVMAWLADNSDRGFYLSSLVIGEIRKGVEMLRPKDPEAAAALDAWLATTIEQFAGRIIPIDLEIAQEWGRLSASDPPPVVDGLIAATAKVKGLTLVTRNTEDVERTGVRCLDPFS